ncbi:type IV toxin-antitoxin system AbiEi family antitoxin domain-containing protein [Arthrobacter sp. H5]|uniref:type IV toxin-antitoxin system AbiEi family antitoxin domain-containing protein n=1 Tax=Arthrobacter sp. H5 TaxID=1267973 RepID=UPI000488BF21|nr:type IV toxin-antitoxin system AbiEi family antitoxin domain-containing protein [Arthrobacter sp. H5]
MSQHIPQWLQGSSGLWRTSDLIEAGLNKRRIGTLVKSRELVRVQWGCYAAGNPWRQLSESERALQRVHAHNRTIVASSSVPVSYSHTSAARIFGLHLWDVDDRIHLTQSFAGASRDRAAHVVRHFSHLREGETALRCGVQVTSLARTVVDCARILSYKQGLIVADHGMRMGTTRQELQKIVNRLSGHKGIQLARRVVENASALSESPGESLSRAIIQGLSIPLPQQQVVVHTRHGEHRLDFAWKDLKLALEFDGKTKYFDYAPTREVLYQERRREKALMEEGWTFIRIEWKDLFDEAALRGRILRAWSAQRKLVG